MKKDNTLYVYHSVWSRRKDGRHIVETRVLTAPADDPNWPGSVTHRGVAFERLKLKGSPDVDEDSADVKYVPEADVFIATAVARRMTPSSCITLRCG